MKIVPSIEENVLRGSAIGAVVVVVLNCNILHRPQQITRHGIRLRFLIPPSLSTPPAMPPIRIRHPKGVSTIEVVFDSPEFTVQDLQQEIYAAAGVLPSRQIRVYLYLD